jgi:hypothetical protein
VPGGVKAAGERLSALLFAAAVAFALAQLLENDAEDHGDADEADGDGKHGSFPRDRHENRIPHDGSLGIGE